MQGAMPLGARLIGGSGFSALGARGFEILALGAEGFGFFGGRGLGVRLDNDTDMGY